MRFSSVPILCISTTLLLLSGCSRHEVSGAYIAKFTNGIYWLQLVETPDKHLTGQLDTAVLDTDGKVAYNNLSVSGAIGGDNISLQLKPISFLPLRETVSGMLSGNKLTLTGEFSRGQPNTIVFLRSDAGEYQVEAKALNVQSQRILAAKAEAEAREKAARQKQALIAQLGQLVSRMEHFNVAADTQLRKLPTAEQRYHAITSKMEDYLKRERQLAGNPKASFTRGRISFAINQGTFASNHLHSEVQSAQWNFNTSATPLMKQAIRDEQVCQATHPSTSDNSTSSEDEAWNSVCLKFRDAFTPYKKKYDAVASSLAHLELVYQKERKHQEQLVQDAQQSE